MDPMVWKPRACSSSIEDGTILFAVGWRHHGFPVMSNFLFSVVAAADSTTFFAKHLSKKVFFDVSGSVDLFDFGHNNKQT